MLARALPSFSFSLSPAARAQLGIFLFAYLLYSAARFVTIGDLGVAQSNADWIMDLERTIGVGDRGVRPAGPHRHRGCCGCSTTSTWPPSSSCSPAR